MTQHPDLSPGRSPVPAADAPAARRGSSFRDKAWLLLCLPVGLTTWAAFLYMGMRARRRRWLAWAGVYLAAVAVWLVLDTPDHPSNQQRRRISVDQCHASRRRTTKNVTAISMAARATKMPVSMNWNGQNR